MDFPVESIHRQAFKAHEAANCAGEQGKYWEMHDRLFKNQRALSPKDLPDHAVKIGMDLAAFAGCLKDGKHSAEIRKDLQEGAKGGIRGAPSFLLGLTEPGSTTIKAVKVIRGAQPYSRFKKEIDELLAPKKK